MMTPKWYEKAYTNILFQPDVTAAFEDYAVGLGQGSGFHSPDLADGLYQMRTIWNLSKTITASPQYS
jgi:hypothetical protein